MLSAWFKLHSQWTRSCLRKTVCQKTRRTRSNSLATTSYLQYLTKVFVRYIIRKSFKLYLILMKIYIRVKHILCCILSCIWRTFLSQYKNILERMKSVSENSTIFHLAQLRSYRENENRCKLSKRTKSVEISLYSPIFFSIFRNIIKLFIWKMFGSIALSFCGKKVPRKITLKKWHERCSIDKKITPYMYYYPLRVYKLLLKSDS